jgi:esterase
MTKVAE